MKRFAAFDIDGTIFRWQLYHELFDALSDELLISADVKQEVLAAREAWRERRLPYHDYEMRLVNAMQRPIVGIEVDRFNAIADRILASKGHHTYRYTVKLLRDLKEKGYVIIAISGSYQQLVDRFAKLHGIDIAVGRNHVIVDGKLTADSEVVFGRKDEILDEIVKRHDLSYDESYAVGDSGGDISMLQNVAHPVAFNPDDALLTIAEKNGWEIVVERKNVAYHLQKGNDESYVLASTDRF
jgi:HAD superfamily hydrolase (TIGR01490 family)